MPQKSTENINIHRPGILMHAARICAKGYKRETMLPRLLGASAARVVEVLKQQEEHLEGARQAQDSTYSPRLHVEVLSALLAESKNAA